MHMQVYRLRERGLRLTGEVVEQRGPDVGELLFKQRLTRSRVFLASLVRPLDYKDYHVIPVMDQAVIVRITPKGMLISGMEQIEGWRRSNDQQYRQGWWCVAVPPGGPA